MPTTIVSVERSEDDAIGWAFQGKNNHDGVNLTGGNVFLGIMSSFWMRFNVPDIPATAIIKSASLELVPSIARGGTSSPLIRTPFRRAWAPDRFTGWTAEFWGSFFANMRNTGGGLIVATSAAVNQSWNLRQQPLAPQRRQRLAQRFVVPAGPGATLGSIDLDMYRVGSPPGSCRIKVYAETTSFVTGGSIPDDATLLATSDDVVSTSVSTVIGNIESFTFSGADQIVLAGGAVGYVELEADYPSAFFDFLVWRSRSAFFNSAGARHYGVGRGWDNQNYPDQASGFVSNNVTPGPDVPWTMGATSVGVPQTTPDIAPVVRVALQESATSPDRSITITLWWVTGTGGNRRDFASFSHATLAPPKLTIEWEPPGGTKGIVICSDEDAVVDPDAPDARTAVLAACTETEPEAAPAAPAARAGVITICSD